MFDVLAKARTSPLLAQQLDWPKRVSMALDAAKVGTSALPVSCTSFVGRVQQSQQHIHLCNAPECSALVVVTKHTFVIQHWQKYTSLQFHVARSKWLRSFDKQVLAIVVSICITAEALGVACIKSDNRIQACHVTV